MSTSAPLTTTTAMTTPTSLPAAKTTTATVVTPAVVTPAVVTSNPTCNATCNATVPRCPGKSCCNVNTGSCQCKKGLFRLSDANATCVNSCSSDSVCEVNEECKGGTCTCKQKGKCSKYSTVSYPGVLYKCVLSHTHSCHRLCWGPVQSVPWATPTPAIGYPGVPYSVS